VLLKGAGVAFAMPEEEYRKIAGQLSKNPKFVPVKRKPAGLTAGAKFGFNLTFGGLNRSWILDGDDQQGYVLYADLNGNGDLADQSDPHALKIASETLHRGVIRVGGREVAAALNSGCWFVELARR